MLGLIPEPQFDPITETIEKAEAAFQRGEGNYNAGHLEMAKHEFNAAIAVILQAPAAWREDRRLQKTFDTLVDRISAYELAALKQGDGFADPAYQPAPIDELQTLTFPPDPQESQLVGGDRNSISSIPLVTNVQVESSIKYFTTGRGRYTLEAALARSGRYRDMIYRVLDEEGVPRELISLAQVESGFQPRAKSYAAAVGLWQFLAWRGEEYGLDRNWWEDNRMDPEKATRAAARHLRDLYNRFGDWYLAMAAYHCGPECVARGVERTGYADFWEISRRGIFGPQTRNYVPVIIALIIISKNAEKYGIQDLLPEPPIVHETVTVNNPVDLRLVAEIVGTSVETIRELNPSLLRLTTPNVPEYMLRIPLASKEIFLKRIAMIPPEKRVFWRWHAVRYGDTLSRIAQQYRTSVKAIAEVNNLDPTESLKEAAELVIPVTSGGGYVGPGIRHVVKRNETLSSIAQRYRVTTGQLMAWNNRKSSLLRVGETLVIGSESTPQASSSAKAISPRTIASTSAEPGVGIRTESLVHRVRKGESLWQIATNYKVSVEELKQRNAHLNGTLQIGDRIVIPAGK